MNNPASYGRAFIGILTSVWNNRAVQWIIRTLYYLSILLGLLYIYGFIEHNTKTGFIYNGF